MSDTMTRKEALTALLEKYRQSYKNLDGGAALFKNVEGVRAARLAAEAVTEEIVFDLKALIEQETGE